MRKGLTLDGRRLRRRRPSAFEIRWPQRACRVNRAAALQALADLGDDAEENFDRAARLYEQAGQAFDALDSWIDASRVYSNLAAEGAIHSPTASSSVVLLRRLDRVGFHVPCEALTRK